MFTAISPRRLAQRSRDAHRHQGGAVALMALAAIMLIVLTSLILFDVAELGTEKTHLQTATDTSAYSQATIEARTMNMMAFTNTGKRMTMGMVNTYLSMNQWLLWAAQIATIGEILGFVMMFVPGLNAIGNQIREASNAIRSLQSGEESVRNTVASKSAKTYFRYWSMCSCGFLCSYPCRKRMRYDQAQGGLTAFWEWWAPSGGDVPFTPFDPRGCSGSTAVTRFDPSGGKKYGQLSCANDDIYNWSPQSLITDYYGRDLLAYDNYQRYMEALSPYWSWTEGVTRGMANSAPITVSYPSPDFENNDAFDKTVPVVRGQWNDTCERAYDHDRGWTSPMGLDYILKNAIGMASGGSFGGSIASGFGEIIALVMIGQATLSSNPLADTVVTPRGWDTFCEDVLADLFQSAQGGGGPFSGLGFQGGNNYVSGFREYGEPYLLQDYGGDRAQWLMDSSTLTFGFRPNANRFSAAADNYDVFGANPSYTHLGTEAGGTWAMSRSEIAFQGGTPNAWSPEWTARMRPVALLDEWNAYPDDFGLTDGFYELENTFMHTTTYAHALNSDGNLITHPHDAGDVTNALISEVLAIDAALRGLDNQHLEGLAK